MDIKKKIIGTIYNPTFPRSGNGFLLRGLNHYFKSEMRVGSEHKGSGHFSLEESNFIKHHDFGLMKNEEGLEVDANLRYVVQYRHPLPSLVSFYEFTCKNHSIDDSLTTWDNFLISQLDYWKKFMHKWTVLGSNALKIEYDDLNENTQQVIKRVIQFMTRDELVNEIDLRNATKYTRSQFIRYNSLDLENPNIAPRDLSKFKYFDKNKFSEIEHKLSDEYLEPANIRRIFDINEK